LCSFYTQIDAKPTLTDGFQYDLMMILDSS